MPRIWLGVSLALCLGTSAFARVPRFSRPLVDVPVVLSDRVKPRLPKPPGNEQPTLTADDALSIASPPMQPPRVDQEQLLGKLIQDTPDSDVATKPDLLARLGELYATQHRYWRRIAIERMTAADLAPQAPNANKLRSEGVAAVNKAKDYLLRTVKTYRQLTDNDAFRSYPKMDLALFLYGYTLQGGKYMKEARAVYDKLLRNYPNSKFVPEAHLSFGDYYFDHGQLADAEARYKMVLKFPKSAVYAYASYKLGWIHFKLQRFQEALEAFFMVTMNAKGNQALDHLAHAAKRDFVRVYAEIGKADKAFLAFQRVDRAAAFEMLETLAQLYVDQGKLDKAIFTFRELIGQSPKDPRVCTWQYRAAYASLSTTGLNNVDKVREIESLVALYRALSANSQQPTRDAQECKANAFAMSSELARAYHNESNKTRNHETLAYAIRLYQVNVAAFPNEPAAPDNRYFLAEAQWSNAVGERNDRLQAELFERAGLAFAEVARTDRTRATAASYASVLAWMNSFEGSLSSLAVPELTRGRPAPSRPLPPRHQQIVDAIAAYATTVNDPRDQGLGQMRFIEAKLYRAVDQHDKAAPLFVGLVATHPTENFAEAAAALAIDSLVILQRLDQMLALADRLAADTKFVADKPELTKMLQHVRSRSMRR